MHRRSLLAAGAAVITSPLLTAVAGAQPVPHRPAPSPPPVTGAPATVEMLSWRTMPAVQTFVAGKGPFLFGIDTGFPGQASVSAAVAQAAGLRVIGRGLASDPSGRNPVTIDRFAPGEIAIGPMTFSSVAFDTLPARPGASSGGVTLDGLLGMDFFAGHTLVLDFKGRKVATERATPPIADGRTVFAYAPHQLIELPLKIGETELRAHLDTGQSRAALIVPEADLPHLAIHGAPRKIGEAHTVSQTLILWAVALDAPVRVGEIAFPMSEVVYPAPIPIANLGAAAFQSMVLRIDHRAGVVQIIG